LVGIDGFSGEPIISKLKTCTPVHVPVRVSIVAGSSELSLAIFPIGVLSKVSKLPPTIIFPSGCTAIVTTVPSKPAPLLVVKS
jgi:hypothetical protein